MGKRAYLLFSAVIFSAAIFLIFAQRDVSAQQPLGMSPETPWRFTFDGETFRTLPPNRASNAEDSSEAVFPDDAKNRFARSAVTTTVSEQTDSATGLKITATKVTYADYPQVVEWVVWFENTSQENTPNLRDVLAADVTFATGGNPVLWHGCGENNDPKQNYSSVTEPLAPNETKEFSPREAYPSYYAFPYFRLQGQSRCYTIAVGWTGAWSASFTADENGDVHFCAGQQTLDLYLKPGEKIRTPRITVMEYSPETDCVNLWRDWFRTYILPRENGKILSAKLILDAHTGGELYKDITEEQQIGAIRAVREKGFRCDGLWIDAGWYLRRDAQPIEGIGYWFGVGDWTPDPERFPHGMKPLADELGPDAKLTLWYEPERIHRGSSKYAEYEKYVIPECEYIESSRMNMASPETVAFLSDLIGNSLRENGVRIYRQDSNGVGPGPFLEHLENTDPNFADRKGLAENLYVQGYLTFWNNLKAMNPGLIFDTCASGGRRNDLDTLRIGAVPLHYSDVGYNDFIEKQRYHDMLDEWFLYYKNIDAHDWDSAKNEYDPYKTTVDFAPFSTLRPYILKYDTPVNRQYVEQFLAVGDLLVTGDYYLLRSGFAPNSWTVGEYFDSALGRGLLRVIRNSDSPEATVTVKLKGLDRAKTYQIKNLDTGETFEFDGAALLDTGLAISLPPQSGRIVQLTEIR